LAHQVAAYISESARSAGLACPSEGIEVVD